MGLRDDCRWGLLTMKISILSLVTTMFTLSSCVSVSGESHGHLRPEVSILEFQSTAGQFSYKLLIENKSVAPLCLWVYSAGTNDTRFAVFQYLYRKDGQNLRFDFLSGPIMTFEPTKGIELSGDQLLIPPGEATFAEIESNWERGNPIPIFGRPLPEAQNRLTGEQFDPAIPVYVELEVVIAECGQNESGSPDLIAKARSPLFLLLNP